MNSTALANPSLVLPPPAPVRGERQLLALHLPHLLEELALEQSHGSAAAPHASSRPSVSAARAPELPLLPGAPSAIVPRPGVPRPGARSGRTERIRRAAGAPRGVPRAIVLVDEHHSTLEPNLRLDAVNAMARRLGMSPRQTIAQATAIAENVVLHAVPSARVRQVLKQVAEAVLAFGSPVSFQVPDTVWVDVSGSHHLFGGVRALALSVVAHVRSLGHAVRVAAAPGPWLARALARHADFDESGVFLLEAAEAEQQTGLLPIGALPLPSEAVTWFSRLGLLSLGDLRRLPRAALAARLGADTERVLELVHGRDDGVLDAYHPEELPCEEQSWDNPLESIEPLLFVLKGLSARLGSRLEGRGQAARELRLTIQYDKTICALLQRERELAGSMPSRSASPRGQEPLPRLAEPGAAASLEAAPAVKEIRLELASPLAHPEDLERILRSRLQKETLPAPARGLRLEVMAITEARQWQMSLNADMGLASVLADPTAMAVLVNELYADVGEGAVGVLEERDSHLLEKSSRLVAIQNLDGARAHAKAPVVPCTSSGHAGAAEPRPNAARLPTRLIAPIEFKAPLQEKEIVVLEQRAFTIDSIRFEQRLESVEWWASSPVSRDYFRVWLSSLSASPAARAHGRRDGVEALVYLNRDDGKKYIQALFD